VRQDASKTKESSSRKRSGTAFFKEVKARAKETDRNVLLQLVPDGPLSWRSQSRKKNGLLVNSSWVPMTQKPAEGGKERNHLGKRDYQIQGGKDGGVTNLPKAYNRPEQKELVQRMDGRPSTGRKAGPASSTNTRVDPNFNNRENYLRTVAEAFGEGRGGRTNDGQTKDGTNSSKTEKLGKTKRQVKLGLRRECQPQAIPRTDGCEAETKQGAGQQASMLDVLNQKNRNSTLNGCLRGQRSTTRVGERFCDNPVAEVEGQKFYHERHIRELQN